MQESVSETVSLGDSAGATVTKANTDFPAFPKVWAIGHDFIRHLFDGGVEVTEKVDGSQFAFGLIDGHLRMRSKSKEIVPDAPEKMFTVAVDRVHDIAGKMPMGVIFYGEYLKQPKHNVLAYNRVPQGNIILFGAYTPDKPHLGMAGPSHPALQEWAGWMGIEVVPVMHTGSIESVEALNELLEHESCLGGQRVEGVVVKNFGLTGYTNGQPTHCVAGKLVSEKFKETHASTWDREHTSKGRYQVFVEGLRTEARWEKAVQHLADRGELENDPRDIGKLIKEVQRDIGEEERERILEFLWGTFGKDIMRGVTRGLPEWYKQRLAARAFDEEAA